MENLLTQGYHIIPNFLSPKEVQSIREHLYSKIIPQCEERFHAHQEYSLFSSDRKEKINKNIFLRSAHSVEFFLEEGAINEKGELTLPFSMAINKIGHALHRLDPLFKEFSFQSKIKKVVQELGYLHPLLVQSMYIFKHPKVGGEVTWHQDQTFLFVEPKPILGLWFAMQRATQENGCLWAIPGEQKRNQVYSLFVKNEKGELKMESFLASKEVNWNETKAIPLEVEEGSLIILDGYCPHKSTANRSSVGREAFTLHLMEKGSRYLESNWLQPTLTSPFLPL